MTTSKEVRPTALELFAKFQPRFEKVALLPVGWGNDEDGRMYCRIDRDGVRVQGYSYLSHPWIDIKESGIRVNFSYDPALKGNIHMQFFDAVVEKLKSSILKERLVRLQPARPFTDIVKDWDAKRGLKLIVDGEPIPGFHAPSVGHYDSDMNGNWQVFVPSDSSEGKAISAAIEYERAGMVEPVDTQALQAHAGDTFDQLLARVA